MSPVEHMAPYDLPTLYTSVPNTEYYTTTQYPIPQHPIQRAQTDEREHVQYDSTMFYHQVFPSISGVANRIENSGGCALGNERSQLECLRV